MTCLKFIKARNFIKAKKRGKAEVVMLWKRSEKIYKGLESFIFGVSMQVILASIGAPFNKTKAITSS